MTVVIIASKHNLKMQKIVLVTGGTGLVGKAIENSIKNQETDEKWVFVGSKDANLW